MPSKQEAQTNSESQAQQTNNKKSNFIFRVIQGVYKRITFKPYHFYQVSESEELQRKFSTFKEIIMELNHRSNQLKQKNQRLRNRVKDLEAWYEGGVDEKNYLKEKNAKLVQQNRELEESMLHWKMRAIVNERRFKTVFNAAQKTDLPILKNMLEELEAEIANEDNDPSIVQQVRHTKT